jgi:hypothetical protein
MLGVFLKEMKVKKLLLAGTTVLLMATSANAQTFTVSAPTIVCDNPSGVGCNGKNVLRAGKYRLLGSHNLNGKGSCQVSGPGGSGYILCSALRGTR